MKLKYSHDRFLYVPKASKEEVLDDLHDFMTEVKDNDFRRILTVAFESPLVLDSFRKIVAKHPPLLQKFETYLQNKAKARLSSWLKANALTIAKLDGQAKLKGKFEEKVD